MRDHWVEAWEALYAAGQEGDPDPTDEQVQEAMYDRLAARADRLKDEWKERGEW